MFSVNPTRKFTSVLIWNPHSVRCRCEKSDGNSIGEDPDPLDLDFDEIAGLHRGDPGWSARGNDVAGKESHRGGDVAEQKVYREDQVDSAAVLLEAAIQTGFHQNALFGMDLVGDHGADGAEGIESLGA